METVGFLPTLVCAPAPDRSSQINIHGQHRPGGSAVIRIS